MPKSSDLQSILPVGFRYRELWLPELANNNATLPSSIKGGHALTLSGARKGTTADGVRGDGSVTSNINCGALHNASAKFWVSLRFKLDQSFAAGAAADQFIWGKYVDADNYIYCWLNAADGKLYFKLRTAATDRFTIAAQDGGADITSWTANTWYHLLCQTSDTAGRGRLKINDGTAVLTNDTNALPNGGDLVFLDYDDPGAGTGFKGVITDIFAGTDDLTTTEETDLYRGLPPIDAVHEYLLDEGRGVTAVDRGSGANNATLDSSCTWAYGKCRQAVLSLDGINDGAISSSGVRIDRPLTLILVQKIKSTYLNLSRATWFYRIRIDASNYFDLYKASGTGHLYWIVYAQGNYYPHPLAIPADLTLTMDQYYIFGQTIPVASGESIYVNGTRRGGPSFTIAGRPGTAATAYLGRSNTGDYNIGKVLLFTIIDGELSEKQMLTYSRHLNELLGLGLNI